MWRVLVNARLTVHLLPASPALVVEALVVSMFLLDACCMLHRGNGPSSCQEAPATLTVVLQSYKGWRAALMYARAGLAWSASTCL